MSSCLQYSTFIRLGIQICITNKHFDWMLEGTRYNGCIIHSERDGVSVVGTCSENRHITSPTSVIDRLAYSSLNCPRTTDCKQWRQSHDEWHVTQRFLDTSVLFISLIVWWQLWMLRSLDVSTHNRGQRLCSIRWLIEQTHVTSCGQSC